MDSDNVKYYKQNTTYLDDYDDQYYEALMGEQNDDYWDHYREGANILTDALVSLIPKDHYFNNIVDLGCGSGVMVSEITKRLKIEDITVVDFSDVMLQHAKNELKSVKSVSTVKHDINSDIPLESKSFELCLSSNVIEHVKDPDQHINECLRLGKHLLLAIPIEEYRAEKYSGGHINFFESEKMCMNFLDQFDLKIINYSVKWVPLNYLYWKRDNEKIHQTILRNAKKIGAYFHKTQRWMVFFVSTEGLQKKREKMNK